MSAIETGIWVGTGTFLVLFIFIILLIIFINRRTLAHQAKMLRIEKERQTELLQASYEATESERRRFGADLHDDLGPLLSTTKMSLGSIRSIEDEDQRLSQINLVNGQIDLAIERMRRVARAMNPISLERFGLLGSIEDMLDSIDKYTENLQVDFQFEGTEKRFSDKKELAIYRILQELCNNVLKHAKATKMMVKMEYAPTHLLLKVSDDGVGLPENFQKKLSIGIKNIGIRANLINAQFEITNNAPAKGVSAILTIPYENATSIH